MHGTLHLLPQSSGHVAWISINSLPSPCSDPKLPHPPYKGTSRTRRTPLYGCGCEGCGRILRGQRASVL